MKNIISEMKFFLLFISSLFSMQLKAQIHQTAKLFVLTGKVKGRDTGYLILRYTDYRGKLTNDTTYLQNGSFEFSGKIEDQPQRVAIKGPKKVIDFNEVSFVNVFMEPTVQNIILTEDDYEHAKMSGSVTQRELDIFNMKSDSISLKYKNMDRQLINAKYAYQNAKNEKEKDAALKKESELNIKLAPRFAETINLDIWFIKHYPNSYVSPFVFYFPATILEVDSATKLFNLLSEKIKNSNSGKYIADLLKKRKKNAIDSVAYNFTAVDSRGHTTVLSDFRDKMVLLDFWASWCAPCRKEIPHLKSLYDQYHPKGFEIIAISIDKDSSAWQNAVLQEKINNWQNILVNKDIATNYVNVTNPIPSQILINGDGKIVWKSDNEKSLDQALKTLIE